MLSVCARRSIRQQRAAYDNGSEGKIMQSARTVRATLKSVLLGSLLLVLLAACGGTAPQAVRPEAPGEFAVTALAAFCIDADGAGVRVSWSAAERAEQYVLLRDGSELVTLGAAVSAFSDTDATAGGAAVEYQVRAVNAGGATVTETVTITVPADLCDTETEIPAPPAEVSDFSASVQCGPLSGVQLTWTAVAGAASYVLERDYTVIAEPDAAALGYLDTAVRPGDGHTYVLRAINAVGISLSAPLPVEIPFADCGLTGPTVAVGGSHSLAIARDGTVWAWGQNWDGQLGVGHTEQLLQPVRTMGLSRVTAVAAGADHSMAIDADGQLWGWGYGGYGQLGPSMEWTAVPYPIDFPVAVVAISAGRHHNLAITADGGVWAWGDNDYGQSGRNPTVYQEVVEPYRLQGVSAVVQVFAQEDSSFLLHADGTVSAFGRNYSGTLGVGHDNHIHYPETVVGLTDVIQVAGGEEHALALTSGGEVFVWGYGDQLGMGPLAVTTHVPQRLAGLDDVISISAGEFRSLAVTADGRVLVWGDVTPEVGDSLGAFSFEPMPVAGIDSAGAVYAGHEHTVAMLDDGSLVAWGFNFDMQLGSSLPLSYAEFVPTLVDQSVVMARSGMYTSLALLSDGTVMGWGAAYTGVAEAGLSGQVAVPTQVDLLTDIVAIEVGNQFSLALTEGGDVWSWGRGSNGRLGLGNNLSHAQPEQIPGLTDVVQISAGDMHSLAIDDAGAVWAWGRNNYGQLGDGSTTDRNAPVAVAGLSNVVAVSAGDYHSLAVDENGHVWAWGRNNYGQLGQGDTVNLSVPTRVADITAVARSVTAAGSSSYVLMGDGTVWAMGQNARGRLGDGTTINRDLPVQIAGLPANIDHISSTYRSVLALTDTGDLFGWGSNDYGLFGEKYPETFLTPTKLNAPGSVDAAFAGRYQSFLVIGGALYAAGDDSDLLLGMGRQVHSAEPLEVLPDVPLAGM